VVGWSIADHMRTGLVADALMMAAATRGSLDGAIFHTDHGEQYTSRQFPSCARTWASPGPCARSGPPQTTPPARASTPR
jgi:transposase InsO family protein